MVDQKHFIDIGPECFADGDEEVISYKGANYYRACDEFVADIEEGGASHCVKRVNHPGLIHEDMDGRTREEPDEGVVVIRFPINSNTRMPSIWMDVLQRVRTLWPEDDHDKIWTYAAINEPAREILKIVNPK